MLSLPLFVLCVCCMCDDHMTCVNPGVGDNANVSGVE